MLRKIIGWIAQLLLEIAYLAHKQDGLNAFFLVLPARFLIPNLRRYGAVIGHGVEMHTPIIFHNTSSVPSRHYHNLHVGCDCYFGRDVFLDLASTIEVEDNVTISMRATILTHTHAGKSLLSQGRMAPYYAPVRLKRGCYIGAGAMLMPGVEIGENAIVGAGAVVTCNVRSNTTVAGVPARPIRQPETNILVQQL